MTSFGLALYEKLSPLEILLISIGVFIIQILLSKFWLKYYRFEPLEWVWRCCSYWKWIPIKKKAEN